MTPQSPDIRAFRALLRLYPASYRARYGPEMEGFFRQERAAGAGGAGFWFRLALDHVMAAATVRRRERGGDGVRGWVDEIRLAARALLRAPAFTVFAAATLALGVGSTAAVFSVLDRVVLRPLPYPGAERMAVVGSDLRHDPGGVGPLSPAQAVSLAAVPGPAEAVAFAAGRTRTLTGMGDPERVTVNDVSAGFFEMFDARPAVGRLLLREDHAAGAPRAAVVDRAFWTERLGAEPGALGRSLVLDGAAYTLVGVLDAGFASPEWVADDAGRIWVSARLAEGEPARSAFWLRGVARLRPGASAAELDAHLDRQFADLYGERAPLFVLGGTARSYQREVVGAIGGALGRALAAVALLLLIACVNVASLLLTRATARRHELAVRAALGAGRRRLVRQLLSESLVLAAGGGALGAVLAFGSVEGFRRLSPGGIPRLAEVSVDGRGLAFALALGVGTVLAFGLLPALRSARRAGSGLAATAGRATGARADGRVRGALVLIETALAVVLVVGSGLLVHDLVRLSREDPGFRAAGAIAMQVDPPRGGEARVAWRPLSTGLLEAVRALPGVESAALTSQLPYGDNAVMQIYTPEGHEGAEEGAFITTILVGGDLFGTLGIPLVDGRGFAPADGAGGAPVAIVNEAFVRAYWPGADPVGRRIKSGAPSVDDEATYTVVGVVADTRSRPGRAADPRVYVPLGAEPWHRLVVVAHAVGDAAALAPGLREVLRRVAPGLPATSVRTVAALASDQLVRPRFYAALFGGFAAVALVLALVGVYGTTAYVTGARTREIGIRMALGAHRTLVVRDVVGRAGAVLACGVAVGLAGAALASRALGDVLLYVAPRDALTYTLVGVLVLLAGVAAAYVPAGRAGRVDPATTLREEA